MSPSTLPIEILEKIIDLLSDDRASLLNCALVSHLLTTRSQQWLFHQVRLDFPGQWDVPAISARIAQFIDILTPRLARYIKNLCIVDYVEDYIDELDSDDEEQTPPRERFHDTYLALLLPKIDKLESFSLSCNGDTAINRLSLPLLSLLITMLASAEVAEFNLFEIESFPIALLAQYCPRIRRINFSFNHTYHNTVPHSGELSLAHLPVPTEVGFLERVVLWEISTRFTDMLREATKLPGACLSFARVEEIEVRARDKSTLLLAMDLFADSADSASLKRLVCDFRQDDCFTNIFFGTSIYNLDFFRLPPSLHKLHVEIPYENGPHFLGWLSSALQDGARGDGPRPLEELVLVIRKESFPDVLDATGLWDALDTQCAAFDQALSMPAYAASLRRVEIFVEVGPRCFYAPYEEQRERPAMEDAIPVSYLSRAVEGLHERLPRLRERGIVSVRWLVTEKRQSGLEVAVRALREGVEGPVHADENGWFKVGREYTEAAVVLVHMEFS